VNDLESISVRLREILQKHAGALQVSKDSSSDYALDGHVGPATLKSWGGRMKMKTIPVAWVKIGKSAVSFHVMGFYGNAALLDKMSVGLKKQLSGKTCFSFDANVPALFAELEQITGEAIAGFRRAGFIGDSPIN
jgi:hypothetical protein